MFPDVSRCFADPQPFGSKYWRTQGVASSTLVVNATDGGKGW